MTKMIVPERLQAGDGICLISPASHAGSRDAYFAKRRWQALGYQVHLAENIGAVDGYFVGDIKENISAIHEAIANPDIKALVALRGGYGSARLLPYLNYDLISKNPKIYLGFSDVTALLNAITVKTNLVTYHGPVGKTKLNRVNRFYLQHCLTSRQPITLGYNNHFKIAAIQSPFVLNPGKVEGRLIGGNFAVFNSLLSTEYLPEYWQDKILFLEDIGEDVYKIDRMLGQLQLAGILNQIAGIVFGQFTHCSAILKHSFTLDEVLDRYIKPLNIPAVAGMMFGHQANMFTLPIGGQVCLDADHLSLHIKA